jgi:hypothetical protein
MLHNSGKGLLGRKRINNLIGFSKFVVHFILFIL